MLPDWTQKYNSSKKKKPLEYKHKTPNIVKDRFILHYTSKNGSRNANDTTKGRRGLPRCRWSSAMHVLNVGREKPPKHHEHTDNNAEEEHTEEE